jgi:hypothetical protein
MEPPMTHPGSVTREPDRLRALRRANEIRAARAELKRQIADGAVGAAEVILESPPAASSWPVAELLMTQRHWGRAKCRRFLAHNQINEFKSVGDLTQRQRQLLARQL